MEAYSEYKDSDVPWIGEIPTDWAVEKTKYQFEIRKRQVKHDEQTILSITQEGIRPKDVSHNEGQMAKTYDGYQEVHSGDFAMNSMDLLTGWVDLSVHDGLTSPDYRVFAPLFPESMEANYYRYVFQLLYSRRIYYKYGQGVSNLGRWRLQAATFQNFPLPKPPVDEQREIVKYLDSKTAEIDGVVDGLLRQHELLERYKRELIAHTVTKGLDPEAPMKESGLQWIGEIPSSWKLLRIGTLYDQRSTKVSDSEFPPLSVTMKGVLPQLENVAKTNDRDNRKLIRAGDFVINSRSDRRGACGVADRDGSCSLISIVLEPQQPIFNPYFSYLFRSHLFADEFYKWGHGIVDDLWTTNWDDMKKIRVPIPSYYEQQLIADYLDSKTAEIDGLITDLDRQVELLGRYRKQVINDVVTGKVRVSEEA